MLPTVKIFTRKHGSNKHTRHPRPRFAYFPIDYFREGTKSKAKRTNIELDELYGTDTLLTDFDA